jgi:hypothetical protein
MSIKVLIPLVILLSYGALPAGTAVSNDDFANAKVITLPYNEQTLNVETATIEAGEPLHSCSAFGAYTGLNSLWFKFTLDQPGVFAAITDQSSYLPGQDSLLSIYNEALTEVACNDNLSAGNLYAGIQLNLEAGTYYLKISNGSMTALVSPSKLFLAASFMPGTLPTTTPSLTPSQTPTSTPTDLPATPTPTATAAVSATPAPVELVDNGDFELDTIMDNIPDGWTAKSLTGDKRVCNKPDKTVAYSGECSFQFKGSIGEASKLKQDLAGIQHGDLLTLSAAISTGYGQPGKLVYVKLRYNEPDAGVNQNGKDQIKLALSTSTAGYLVVEETLTVDGTPTKFFIALRFRGISSKVRVDAVSLTRTTH